MSDIEASVDQEVALGGQLDITVPRDELAQKLALVSRGVSTRTAVQILGGILLRAAGNRVELAATDMELSLRTPLDATVVGDGAVVVPGKLFADLSRLLPEGDVELQYRPDENVLQVRCGPAEYRLNTYSAEDFPRLPDSGAAPTHTVDAASLLPPPRPAPCGMFLRRQIDTPPFMLVAAKNAFAARTTRFSSPIGIDRSSHWN